MTSGDGREGRYPESRVQDAFVQWFKDVTGYEELYEDAYTQRNTPMDSVGFIGATPVLIEVKARVHSGMIRHERGSQGNLEYKIYRAIRDLYTGAPTYIVNKLHAWDRSTAPEIVFVAETFDCDSLFQLREVLERWGHDWYFGARIYRWQGGQGICLYTQRTPETVAPDQIQFPEWKPVPAAKRTPKLTEQELHDLLGAKGLDACLVAMYDEMKRRGVKLRMRYVDSISYGKTALDGGKKWPLVNIWPRQSTAHDGMLVSFYLEQFPACFAVPAVADTDVPGAPAPVVGFLNHQRYLRSPEEVTAFWAALTPTE